MSDSEPAAEGGGGTLDPETLAEPVVAVCGRGEASAQVAGMLTDAGVDAVNLGREAMSGDGAFEAELGPNDCAVE